MMEECSLVGECYICSQDNAPLSPCKCKNMFIHEICQLKSIEKLNSPKCSVCKTEYSNITINTITETHCTGIGRFVVCIVTASSIMAFLFVYQMIILFTTPKDFGTLVLAAVFGALSSSTMAVSLFFCINRNREKLTTSEKRIVAKIKNMSDNAALLNHDDNIIIEMVQ